MKIKVLPINKILGFLLFLYVLLTSFDTCHGLFINAFALFFRFFCSCLNLRWISMWVFFLYVLA